MRRANFDRHRLLALTREMTSVRLSTQKVSFARAVPNLPNSKAASA